MGSEETGDTYGVIWVGYLERYSKPQVLEKKKSPRAAANASS
jgi:hypothetical protein